MLERALIGLFGASVVSLLAVTAASMMFGAQFELLLSSRGHGTWMYLALCTAYTALALLIARPVAAWRVALGISAALLLVLPIMHAWALRRTGLAAAVWHDGSAGAMALACLALAAVLIWLALAIGEHKVKRTLGRNGSAANRAARVSSPVLWFGYIASMLRQYAPFILAAAAFVDGFRLAYLDPQNPLAGAGALGMLLAFFLLLPAASIRAWLPRSAAACLTAAAVAYGWLVAIAWNPAWAMFAGAALWLAWQGWIRNCASVHAARLAETA